MSFALFIDHIYAKLRFIFIVIDIIFFAVATYLYVKLPGIIPTHWGPSFTIDNWGRKETLFIMPVLFLLCILLSSKKVIHAHETTPSSIMTSEIIFLFVLSLLAAFLAYVYWFYFLML